MTRGLVVVLGETGRNFAAGMSGGIAYVYDEKGDFADRKCNRAAVDLESLIEHEEIDQLERLLRRHLGLTASPRASEILATWPDSVGRFIKVFPHEYKRVLGIPLASAALVNTVPRLNGTTAAPSAF
jgi:glutamate synthase domain-containing protein 3